MNCRMNNAAPRLPRARRSGADFCGVDLLFGGAGPLVCEVNSNPNFKSSLDCTGVNMADKIVEYIEERI